MTRAELARELREFGEWMARYPHLAQSMLQRGCLHVEDASRFGEVALRAAALLEDYNLERDARRWQLIEEALATSFQGQSFLIVSEREMESKLRLVIGPPIDFLIDDSVYKTSVRDAVDAALDAWIAEHADEHQHKGENCGKKQEQDEGKQQESE